MQPIQGEMMWLCMVSSIMDFLNTSRTSSCCQTAPKMFQQLQAYALKCDTHYWKHQGKKATPSGCTKQSAFTSAPAKSGNLLAISTNTPKPGRTNVGIGVDRKLTEVEQEHCHLKGLCYYCALSIDLPAPNCHN